MWRIHVPKRVAKVIALFPKDDRARILHILREFEMNPWAGDIVKLKGEENKWRRRVGSYRVFYTTDSRTLTVEILEIERRTSRTY